MSSGSKYRRSLRVAVASIGLVSLLLTPESAGAHSPDGEPTTLTATRDVDGRGTDQSFASGTWSADVVEVQGKPAQAFVQINVDVGCDGTRDDIAGIGGRAVVGRTLRSNQLIPAACTTLRLFISGGKGPASVTVKINHP